MGRAIRSAKDVNGLRDSVRLAWYYLLILGLFFVAVLIPSGSELTAAVDLERNSASTGDAVFVLIGAAIAWLVVLLPLMFATTKSVAAGYRDGGAALPAHQAEVEKVKPPPDYEEDGLEHGG